MLFLSVRLITLPILLKSPSLFSAISSLSFITCTLSTKLLGKFLVAILGSSPKKRLPSTKILLTRCPFTVMFPFSSTCTPGNFFNKSSNNAVGKVLNAEALNSMVSCLNTTGGRSENTITSSSCFAVLTILRIPKLILGFTSDKVKFCRYPSKPA